MSITLKEFDSYSTLQTKLEHATQQASDRVRPVIRSMESINLAGDTHRVAVQYTRDGLMAIILPDTLERAAVRLNENLALVPEDTALAIRTAGWTVYALTSPKAILTGLRRAHRNKKQVISVLQSYIDQLESLEDWIIEQDAINRKEKYERENGFLLHGQAEIDALLAEPSFSWDDLSESESEREEK